MKHFGLLVILVLLCCTGNAFALEIETTDEVELQIESDTQFPTQPIEKKFLEDIIEAVEEEQKYFDNTADEASISPHIPEPMVFDLVRPLAAKKGELEINVLGVYPLKNNQVNLEWAPEIEYAFKDGQALELELPFLNGKLETLKLAYQLTLPRANHSAKYNHGIQTIARYNVHPKIVSAESTYLLGVAINKQWSWMNITGFRTNFYHQGAVNMDLLANNSIFYHINKRTTVGFEKNLRLRNSKNYDLSLIPQVFVEFGRFTSLQVGAGVTRQRNGVYRPLAALRLIVAFR
jgi:hypothetical protein